ncbi:MAG: Rpn family recombination-promoting nuclease/putative transposase [Firmicutes bacterium]|nr:Rpn family recombination-promoting nuclease/putative transposase [Bacillota bacterium]
MKTLDPMMDIVFKALFGREDKTSKKLLIGLLNDILEESQEDKIVDVIHMNPFNYKDFEGDKLSILDIKAKIGTGATINIEVQVRKEDNYRRRSLFYWAKTYGDTISEAEDYDSLKKAIVINILGYKEITEGNKLHNVFKILEKDQHFILTDDLEIHYLELPKLIKKEIEDLDKIEMWLEFFKEAGREGNEERINSLMERSEIMTTAMKKLEEISADEKMRELYRAREKARLDMVSKLRYAEKKGLEEGAIKKAKEMASELLKDGMEVTLVAKYTKLGLEEIQEIKKKI